MSSFDKWGSMDFKMELREKNHIFSLWNIRAGDFDNTLPINSDEEPFIYQASNVKKKCNFSKSPGYIRKIPLNPPLQKGEAVGMPQLIEKLRKNLISYWQTFIY